MNVSNLVATDLNLLVAFETLMSERSVTRAARRVGISQPAMSSTLRRLRELFEDELLVRAGSQMLPTPRALALIEPVRAALATINEVLQPARPFDESGAHRFRVAMTDYVGFTLLPKLMASLRRRASNATIEVFALEDWATPKRALQSGDIGLAVSFFRDVDGRLDHEKLFDDEFVCVVRKNHPEIGSRLSLHRYCSVPHLLIAPRGVTTGAVDVALARLRRKRHVAVTVPHFQVALEVIVESDVVGTIAKRVVLGYPKSGLRAVRPPVEIDSFDVSMVWDPHMGADPAQQWFRGVVRDVAKGIARPRRSR